MLRTPNVKNLRLQTPAAEPSRAKNLRLTSHRVGRHLPVPSGSATTRLSREFADRTEYSPCPSPCHTLKAPTRVSLACLTCRLWSGRRGGAVRAGTHRQRVIRVHAHQRRTHNMRYSYTRFLLWIKNLSLASRRYASLPKNLSLGSDPVRS
mgnify:CR=1 FL=1